MVANELLMQFQADILDVPVIRSSVTEKTAFGAANAAGVAIGFWSDLEELRKNWEADKIWKPQMSTKNRENRIRYWKKAVERTFNWIE
jgi:glycerol kinase